MKTLNLNESDRIGCVVTYNVNRFEVYHKDGWMITAAYDKGDLKYQLSQNAIAGATFDSAAQSKYLA
jgi:hypothetical protein